MSNSITVAGNAGKDAEVKTLQSGESFCSFSIPSTVGFGDREQTVWFDVTKWGKGADKLAGFIRKGTPITVFGEFSTREHDGKTYLQIRADRVKLQGGKQEASGGATKGGKPQFDDDDNSDFVPF